MRVGVSGKGGVGKTTISAVLARTLARRGHVVIAIDCDSDPNLAVGIGLGEDGAARLRPALDQSGLTPATPVGLTPKEFLAAYGEAGPDGVTVLLGSRVERAGVGCMGGAKGYVRDFITYIGVDLPGASVVADMEAGLEHLSQSGGALRDVDLLLVVIQPSAKVLMTAARTYLLAVELGIPRIAFVGNRARPGDHERLQAFADERRCELLVVLPEDPSVQEADRHAVCLLDQTPTSPVVTGVARLADELEARLS